MRGDERSMGGLGGSKGKGRIDVIIYQLKFKKSSCFLAAKCFTV